MFTLSLNATAICDSATASASARPPRRLRRRACETVKREGESGEMESDCQVVKLIMKIES